MISDTALAVYKANQRIDRYFPLLPQPYIMPRLQSALQNPSGLNSDYAPTWHWPGLYGPGLVSVSMCPFYARRVEGNSSLLGAETAPKKIPVLIPNNSG